MINKCNSCGQLLLTEEARAMYLNGFILSFEEHCQCCDECALTWSEDFCDDFKLFLKLVPDKVAMLERLSNGDYYKVSISDIQVGVAMTKPFTAHGKTYHDKLLPLLRKYGMVIKI